MDIKTHVCHDEKGNPCKILFDFVETFLMEERSGGLTTALEYSRNIQEIKIAIGYDLRTNEWHGTRIYPDNWVSLSEEEIDNLVEKYDLDKLVKECIENG